MAPRPEYSSPLGPRNWAAIFLPKVEARFAKTMADRDYAAFTKFLADEAIFMANGQPARGAKVLDDFFSTLG